MRHSLIAILLVIAFIPAGLAADKWIGIQTAHFSLIGNAGEGEIRRVGENLEQFREAVTRLLPKAKTDSSATTVVLVFRDDASLRPFKPLYNGKPANVAGYFQGGRDVNYIALRADEETPRVIYHEYFHLVAAGTMGRLPPWFNEGFAEYYSTFEVLGKDQKVQVGKPIDEHVRLLRERSLLPFDVLFSVSQGSPYYYEADKQGLFYAQSWATIHYILMSDGGKRRNQLPVLLQQLDGGTSAADSIKSAFQMNLSVFQKEVDQYMTTRMTLPAIEFTFKDKLTVEAAAKPRVLTEAEAQYYLGDLLLHTNRLEDAETYLKKSIALDAKLAAPQSSLGMLRLRQGNQTEALSYLKKAAESDSRSHLVHYYYAQTLQRESAGVRPGAEDLETMRAELKKSLTLAPNFLPAVDMLAYVNLLRNADLAEAATFLRGALEAAPGRDDLSMRLGEVLYRSRELSGARASIQRVLTSPATDPTLKSRARSLLQTIDLAEIAQSAGLSERPGKSGKSDKSDDGDDSVADDPFPSEARADPPRIERRSLDDLPGIQLGTDSDVLKRVDPVTGKTQVVSGSTEGQTLLGLLTSMDCSPAGVTLVVNTGQDVAKLHSDHIEDIQFVSFVQSVKGDIECGPFPNVRVRINYKPDPSGKSFGTPVVVAFVE